MLGSCLFQTLLFFESGSDITPELRGCPHEAFNLSARKSADKHSIGQSAGMTYRCTRVICAVNFTAEMEHAGRV